MAASDDLRSIAERAAQYEPAPRPGSSSVTDQLLLNIDTDLPLMSLQRRRELRQMLDARREMGRAKYGCELQAGNGRNPWTDCLQELLDAAVYITQATMEGRPIPDEVMSALQLVSVLVEDAPR